MHRRSNEETVPEPDDVSPVHEEDDPPHVEDRLDSSDDEAEDGDVLASFQSAMPAGMCVAPPRPLQSQLNFKSATAKELQGKVILYNWIGIGWWAGCIKRPRRQVLTRAS